MQFFRRQLFLGLPATRSYFLVAARSRLVSTMSQARVFSIVGDSNVKRHMNATNCRDRAVMLEAQVIPCSKLAIFQQSMRSVRETSNVCIVSCISNFITDSDPSASTMSLRLDPVYKEFFAKLVEVCRSNPGRTYFVCPPMFRTSPGAARLLRDQLLDSLDGF